MAVSNYTILKKILGNKNEFWESYNKGTGFMPLDTELRLNWKCNAKCVMCGVSEYFSKEDKNKRKELDYQEITKILIQLKDMGCSSITLSGGEPTLRKDLVNIVAYASRTCSLNVSLNTNGFLLTKQLLEQLISAGINSITFSLDSPIEEVHDQIRGLNGSYRRIAEAIDYINTVINNNSKSKVYIFVNCVVLKNNIHTFNEFSLFYDKHKFHHLNFSPASINTPWDIWTAGNETLRPLVEDIIYLKKVIKKLCADMGELQIEDPFGDSEDEIKKNLNVMFSHRPSVCFVSMLHSVIQSNGDVIPCCYAPDSFIMGNISDMSFEKIWNGYSYKLFREQCRKVSFPMCTSCRQYELVNRRLYNQFIGGLKNE